MLSIRLLPMSLAQVLMCPSPNCMASGCINQRLIDRQPVACGVETTLANIGTTYTLTFAVYNSAGLVAMVSVSASRVEVAGGIAFALTLALTLKGGL